MRPSCASAQLTMRTRNQPAAQVEVQQRRVQNTRMCRFGSQTGFQFCARYLSAGKPACLQTAQHLASAAAPWTARAPKQPSHAATRRRLGSSRADLSKAGDSLKSMWPLRSVLAVLGTMWPRRRHPPRQPRRGGSGRRTRRAHLRAPLGSAGATIRDCLQHVQAPVAHLA
jgi:hypothetical protein